MWRLVYWTAWLVTLGLLALAVLRIGYHDGTILLVWFNAFTLYVYLPAYAVLGVAVWRKWWLLSAVAATVIACHVGWVAGDFGRATPFEPPPGATTATEPVRLFYANIRGDNPDYDRVLTEIAREKPDVVVLVEITYRWWQTLREAAVMEPYLYGTPEQRGFPGEVVVFSKIPIRNLERVQAVGRIGYSFDLVLDEGTLRIVGLHAPRPQRESSGWYYNYWDAMIPLLADEPTPLVVVGDFNATQHSRVHQQITSLGLRSAHVDRGRGYATSWPNGQFPVPPIRIDHAFLSRGVECLSIREGVGRGSDHKPLILELRAHGSEDDATPSQQ